MRSRHKIKPIKLQFLLLPIRDWNIVGAIALGSDRNKLQFLLLPIRDWNRFLTCLKTELLHCNFYYSLLGIETEVKFDDQIAISQDCNFYYSLLGIETDAINFAQEKIKEYCNFYYSLLGIETLL